MIPWQKNWTACDNFIRDEYFQLRAFNLIEHDKKRETMLAKLASSFCYIIAIRKYFFRVLDCEAKCDQRMS